ncbi:hypothetical protein P879_03050 [Paragonimus westermani]|uniref:Frizzled 1/7 n=1 Tax=Paragonimus westermani TaxID=34504 RepID=A0A8T0DV09_9TREM|nr:hypothetical protein P879_03050 [Paragonimus westermani]
MICLLVVLLFLSAEANNAYIQRTFEDPYAETPKCEPIRVKACQDLPYNITIFPNDMGQSTQEEAGQEVGQFAALVRIRCSSSLKLFLCSLYFPVCTGMKKPLPPCRSLCEQNKRDCEPLMRGFNFEWPAVMDCARFPEDSLCISENKTEQTPKDLSFTCPVHMRVPPSFEFRIRMGSGQVIPDCGIPCSDFLFSDSSSRRFSRLWIGLWSCLCAASTLFTVLTFLIDMPRFQYPERPIIFLSACYLMVALTYVAGFILNDKVACAGPFPAPSNMAGHIEMPRLITQGTKFEGCIILFMLLYFFSMASSIWWVVLTITWYLAAKCHWAHEAISRNAQYLHFAAWALPAAKTIGILAFGKVDGDPLSGVCFTGLTDPVILRVFLIVPLCLYLVIGTGFLFAGFVSLFKIRTIIKTGGSKTDDLEKLIMRIGVFSLLYIVPAMVVIACYFHESRMAEKWMLSWYVTEVCRKMDPYQLTDSVCPIYSRKILEAGGTVSRLNSVAGPPGSAATGEIILAKLSSLDKPEFELFMIKYLMTLIVGITSGIWIWSGKTLISWQRFFARLCRRRGCCGRRNSSDSKPDGLAVPGVSGSIARRRLAHGTLAPNASQNLGSVPLLQRGVQSSLPTVSASHPGQASFVFNQDTTTTSGGWISRGAPSGITAPPPDSAPVTSFAAKGWLSAMPTSVVAAGATGVGPQPSAQPVLMGTTGGPPNSAQAAGPNSGLGLV